MLMVYSVVMATLEEALAEDPDRKCFRLIGGVLAERTVKEVFPALKTNRDGVCAAGNSNFDICSLRDPMQILKVVSSLGEQYKTKEGEFDNFKRDYGIRPMAASN